MNVKMLSITVSLVGFMFITAKKEIRQIEKAGQSSAEISMSSGILKINEFAAKKSIDRNEYGVYSDWFELYNTSNASLHLEKGKWFVTDAFTTENQKYELPSVTIPAHGFIVIWCDTLNKVGNQIHTNFHLSAEGEDLGIFYKTRDGLIAIDRLTYSSSHGLAKQSFGRNHDGAEDWTFFENPTPGYSNED